MPRKVVTVYTCGECEASGTENSAEGFEIVIRNSGTGDVVTSHQWEGCVAHREALDALVGSILAYGRRMRDFVFKPEEPDKDHGYGGPQPSTRGAVRKPNLVRAIATNGAGQSKGARRTNPKPALPPASPPSPKNRIKPLEELSAQELGRKLVAAPEFKAALSPPKEPPPASTDRPAPARTPASTESTEGDSEDNEANSTTQHRGNVPAHTGTALVENGKVVMNTVRLSCLDHNPPKPVSWRGRGSHMADWHDKGNYWDVSWRYDNLPPAPDGGPWKMHECGYVVYEAKNEICLLEFPNESGLEGHRRNVGHQPEDDD